MNGYNLLSHITNSRPRPPHPAPSHMSQFRTTSLKGESCSWSGKDHRSTRRTPSASPCPRLTRTRLGRKPFVAQLKEIGYEYCSNFSYS